MVDEDSAICKRGQVPGASATRITTLDITRKRRRISSVELYYCFAWSRNANPIGKQYFTSSQYFCKDSTSDLILMKTTDLILQSYDRSLISRICDAAENSLEYILVSCVNYDLTESDLTKKGDSMCVEFNCKYFLPR